MSQITSLSGYRYQHFHIFENITKISSFPDNPGRSDNADPVPNIARSGPPQRTHTHTHSQPRPRENWHSMALTLAQLLPPTSDRVVVVNDHCCSLARLHASLFTIARATRFTKIPPRPRPKPRNFTEKLPTLRQSSLWCTFHCIPGDTRSEKVAFFIHHPREKRFHETAQNTNSTHWRTAILVWAWSSWCV